MGVPISSLPAADALTGAEQFPLVQSGITKRTAVDSVPYTPAGIGAVTTTVQAKLRETVSVKDFGAAGDGVADDTAAIQAAIDAVKNVGGRVVVPQGTYLISSSLNIGDEVATYSAVEFVGQGLPTIKSNNLSAPIIKIGGAVMRLEGFYIQYISQPTSGQTNAAAIRTYNLSYSIIQRIFMYQVRNGIDQYQGSVAGTGYNTFFSNTISDIVIQRYTGHGIIMQPYVGGNSGSVWSNIYINHNLNNTPSGAGATLGAFWLQTCQNEVIDLLNLEWQRNSGPLLVLSQAGNTTVRGLHIEGVYPTTAYSALVDVLGGDGSCPTFDCITIVGSDWTGYGGANLGALFRLSGASPAKITVAGVQCYNNTNPSYMQAVNQGGSTAYGATIEFDSVYDLDNSLSNSGTPRVSFGTAGSLANYPLLRWNDNIYRSKIGGVYYLPGLAAAPSSGIYPAPSIVMNTAVDGSSARGWEIWASGDFSNPTHGTVTYPAFWGSMTADATAYAYFNSGDYILVSGTTYKITAKYSGNTFNVSPNTGATPGTNVNCQVASPQYRNIA